jgi:hypothetical protein
LHALLLDFPASGVFFTFPRAVRRILKRPDDVGNNFCGNAGRDEPLNECSD